VERWGVSVFIERNEPNAQQSDQPHCNGAMMRRLPKLLLMLLSALPAWAGFAAMKR
jgi:hypothetical protein